ncbi:hypothetical protein [Burkholderia territorii]|uniref:hypothetical protein n=1 Tax=Burkholderia territorii TaxID=1503055 RepID=UPI000A69D557|nr:hypothetical protein [Burkholderia territorii]
MQGIDGPRRRGAACCAAAMAGAPFKWMVLPRVPATEPAKKGGRYNRPVCVARISGPIGQGSGK